MQHVSQVSRHSLPISVSEPRREVAAEIFRQLGGTRFALMTGARDFIHENDGLYFNVPRFSTRGADISRVSIKLRGDDTYTVSFLQWKPRDLDFKIIAIDSGVHADQLQERFTERTGLFTSIR